MKNIFLSLLYVCAFVSTKAQTFTSTVNQLVPDNGPVTAFALDVNGLPDTINSSFGVEKVCLNMSQTWDGDMAVWIQAPDGTTTLLFQGVGGDGDNFDNTCLNGVSSVSIADGSAPFTGEYKAMGLLGTVNNGQNPNGTWNLLCQDQGAWDFAFLSDWSITFSNAPAPGFNFDSTRLPIVIVNTSGQPVQNDVKIPATFKIIDNGLGQWNYIDQTSYAYDGFMTIEYQGYTGPYYPKKNYDFNVVDSAGLNIDTPLLGMPSENDWILKSEYTDVSLIKNSLTYHMARKMGRYAPRTMFCEMFLNGEYIGVYNLTEKVKRDANRVNISKLKSTDTTGVDLTGGYIIEMNINGAPGAWNSAYLPINSATCTFPVEFKHVYPRVDSIQTVQHDYIKNFVDSFENALVDVDFQNAATGWRKYAGEGSFVDFLIVNEFSSNYDSYGRSTFMYKEKATDGGKLHIGPAWDYDRAYTPGQGVGWVHEITHPYWPFPFWWSKFRQDSVFMRDLYCRWHTLRENTLEDDSFYAYVDSVSEYIHDAAVRNFTRWPELGITDYDAQVVGLKDFITARNLWIDNALPDTDLVEINLTLDNVQFCDGDSVTVFATTNNNATYEWKDGSTADSLIISAGGLYDVTVSNMYGCKASDAFMAATFTLPDASFTWTDLGNGSVAFNAVASGVSYLWTFSNDSVSTASNPVITFNDSLIATLSVTNANGCSSTYTDTAFVITRVNELQANNDFIVYPNPTDEFIRIQTNRTDVSFVQIVDAAGRVLFEETFSKLIDMRSLVPGVYELQIVCRNGLVERERFVKQ